MTKDTFKVTTVDLCTSQTGSALCCAYVVHIHLYMYISYGDKGHLYDCMCRRGPSLDTGL